MMLSITYSSLLILQYYAILNVLRYDEQMENILDEAYERFVAKKEGSTKQRKRAKQVYSEELLEVLMILSFGRMIFIQ